MGLSRENSCDTAKPPVIDSVRRNLIEKVQQLQQSIEKKDDAVQINDIINELKYHAVFYFTQKEKLMLINRNTSYHHHRQEHDRFIWKLTDLQSELKLNHLNQAITICTALQQWLCDNRTAIEQNAFQPHFSKL